MRSLVGGAAGAQLQNATDRLPKHLFPENSALQWPYKVQQFRCYRSGPRRLLGEYGGIEADRQTTSSRQLAADS